MGGSGSSWRRGGAVALAALVVAAVPARAATPLPVEAELERLGSTDGLYTAPQIRAQAGFALTETAYARAALAALGERGVPQMSATTRARLRPDPQDGPVEAAWARTLLARSAVPGFAVPSAAQVRRLERAIGARGPAAERVLLHADLLDVAAAAGVRPRAATRRAGRAAVVATRRDRDPAVQLARISILRRLGGRPDATVRAVARGRRLRPPADRVARVVRAAAIVAASRFVTPAADRRAPERRLVAAVREAPTPGAVWLAVDTLAAGRSAPPAEVRALAPLLREALGTEGAIAERAVFATVPKAVWLVAHLRRALGLPALPQARAAALERLLRSSSARRDPDAVALLRAAARLAGARAGGAPAGVVVPTRVRDAAGALAWSQQVRVAHDLGGAPAPTAVQAFDLERDVDHAALGALLHAARQTGATVRLPRALRERFVRAAPGVRYRDTRWLLSAAAGLAALGHTAEADGLVGHAVRVGCRDFPHLVRGANGACDLESTVLVLELRGSLLAVERLARAITGTA